MRLLTGCTCPDTPVSQYPAYFRAVKTIGLDDIARMWANPNEDGFARIVAACQSALDAGIRSLYIQSTGARPEWCVGGPQPTYTPGGCIEADPANPGNGGIKFASDRSYCSVPPHIDPAQVQAWAAELATALKPFAGQIAYWSAWNEPGQDTSWPPWHAGGDSQLTRLISEVSEPFLDGIRSVLPKSGTAFDADMDIPPYMSSMFSAALHPYSWSGPFISGSLSRIAEFMGDIDSPGIISEIGSRDSQTGVWDVSLYPQWLDAVAKRGDISTVILFESDSRYELDMTINPPWGAVRELSGGWWKPGTGAVLISPDGTQAWNSSEWQPAHGWLPRGGDGTFASAPAAVAVQQKIQELRGRRRAS